MNSGGRSLCRRVASDWEEQAGLMVSRCSYVDGYQAQLTPFQLRANNVIQRLIFRYVTSIISDHFRFSRDSFVCVAKRKRIVSHVEASTHRWWRLVSFSLNTSCMCVYNATLTSMEFGERCGEAADDKRFFYIVRLSRFWNWVSFCYATTTGARVSRLMLIYLVLARIRSIWNKYIFLDIIFFPFKI